MTAQHIHQGEVLETWIDLIWSAQGNKKDFCLALNITGETLRNWIKREKLPGGKIRMIEQVAKDKGLDPPIWNYNSSASGVTESGTVETSKVISALEASIIAQNKTISLLEDEISRKNAEIRELEQKLNNRENA